MKIYITGATGFIGVNLQRHFQDQGHDVVAHVRGQDLAQELARTQPDLILHAAAEIYDVDRMFDSNIVLTAQCIEHVKSHAARMIYFGSSSEYGWRDIITTENTVIEPHTAYAGTKAAGTYMCQGYAREFDLDIVVMRLYSIYGPGERPHRLFPRLWCAFRLGRAMQLVNGVHDFVYIDDAVAAVDLVVNSAHREPGEIINVCSNQQHTNLEVLQTFERVTKTTAPIKFLDSTFSTQPVWRGDDYRLRSRYNWRRKHDLASGVQDFLAKANYD